MHEKAGAENFPHAFATLSNLIIEAAGLDLDDGNEDARG